jgi:cell division protein FtsI/penicillin-binding protein 2
MKWSKSPATGEQRWQDCSLGSSKFYEYCKAFGIGERTGIELNGEEKGILRTN